jgi:nucleotide-binding universal stress UspA family protein
MYKHILIPTDGSALSEKAIRQGVGLAKSITAKVTVLTVSPRFHTFAVDPFVMADTPDKYEQHCNERAQRYLAFAEMTANSAGVPYNGVHVIEDHSYQAIIDTAKAQGCDLIFMASHGRKGVSALVLGSETTKVLTHSSIPTLVCR